MLYDTNSAKLSVVFLYNTMFNEVSLFDSGYLSIIYGKVKNDVLVELHEFLTTVRGR